MRFKYFLQRTIVLVYCYSKRQRCIDGVELDSCNTQVFIVCRCENLDCGSLSIAIANGNLIWFVKLFSNFIWRGRIK